MSAMSDSGLGQDLEFEQAVTDGNCGKKCARNVTDCQPARSQYDKFASGKQH
jgi:hypothetical protein